MISIPSSSPLSAHMFTGAGSLKAKLELYRYFFNCFKIAKLGKGITLDAAFLEQERYSS